MIFTLNAEPRNTKKKSDLTALRAEGKIPAVLYGAGVEATKLSINDNEFMKCYKKSFTEFSFYEVKLEGEKYRTILKDKQMHPVNRNFLHIDFQVLDKDSVLELDIPVNYVGEPIGLKEGGFMDVIQRSVKVICKAADVPEGMELDVSNLRVGDALHISDLPKGVWEYKDHDDVTMVVIHAKAAEEEEPVELEEGEEDAGAEEESPSEE
ncbi:MAG: 50S ribosomal protein L25 [Candidatus Cloacimonadaceae bacterium]|jgi:large subunit ribosomal protein L25|nr:50S ribosomal protein L25 [Candidatus Cloacimonadota bacterium]MDY0127237.1 50S ribosomal protein L25 [Candidatus Cloacimonadaceae bacterium]MCB5254512.1 50S ribosomal protein L25 [Candidatus Cloacimonadota bacterium]MCK9178265.1 50S ribosomal protein L25 [Candidatus Cloacimonadota bacterium]MCK9242859.1 50S ribosomal protein L25 [Candidatus Cloacimonadota bacterium]